MKATYANTVVYIYSEQQRGQLCPVPMTSQQAMEIVLVGAVERHLAGDGPVSQPVSHMPIQTLMVNGFPMGTHGSSMPIVSLVHPFSKWPSCLPSKPPCWPKEQLWASAFAAGWRRQLDVLEKFPNRYCSIETNMFLTFLHLFLDPDSKICHHAVEFDETISLGTPAVRELRQFHVITISDF